jgi:hypothetical protein
MQVHLSAIARAAFRKLNLLLLESFNREADMRDVQAMPPVTATLANAGMAAHGAPRQSSPPFPASSVRNGPQLLKTMASSRYIREVPPCPQRNSRLKV